MAEIRCTDFDALSGDVVFTTTIFPDDLDTTSLGLDLTEHVDLKTKMDVMDYMLDFKTADGITIVYFDKDRPRIGMTTSCYC